MCIDRETIIYCLTRSIVATTPRPIFLANYLSRVVGLICQHLSFNPFLSPPQPSSFTQLSAPNLYS